MILDSTYLSATAGCNVDGYAFVDPVLGLLRFNILQQIGELSHLLFQNITVSLILIYIIENRKDEDILQNKKTSPLTF